MIEEKVKILEQEFEIKNKLGLHARAAALFVQVAMQYQAEVLVEKDGEVVNGKSIMGLMMLAAPQGSKLKIKVEGQEAEKMLQELGDLIERKFNEEE
jgi:phosphocarrier protein